MTPPRPNPLLAAVAAPPIAEAGKWASAYDGRHGTLINCSQAVPNHPPPAEFAARLAEAAGSPAAARYGDILGDQELRHAYAGHVSGIYGAPIDARQIAITSGCNQAFFAAMIAVAGAGENVVLPRPWYFNHEMTPDMLGIEARVLATTAEAGFLPDPEAFEALIDGRTRALVLVSPNNPTGAIYPPQLIAELRAKGADEIQVVVGGVVPPQDYDFLRDSGVSAVFGPGSNILTSATEVLDLIEAQTTR